MSYTQKKQYQNILQYFNFSGQLECEGILPTQSMFTSNKLPNVCEQAQPNTAPSQNRHHERGDEAGGTSIVAASLV
jgi:Asp-tRNA(Asn)/Glu-tRNA(Gln) amidotransferase C subunit